MASLTDNVRGLLPEHGRFGVYARNLSTGETVAIDADDVKPTASAAKTFILVHYAQLVAAGDLDPQTRIPYKGDDHVVGSGVMRYLSPGLEPTLDDLAWLMTIVSDNVATNVLLRETGGPEAVNARMDALGLPNARIHAPVTFDSKAKLDFATATPRDLAEAYTHLDDRCRTMLFRQQHTSSLPRRIPHLHDAVDFDITMPVRAYNKTGSVPGVSTDAGLFETESAAWIAAAMGDGLRDVGGGPDDVGPTTLAAIGKALYDAWSS